MARGLLFNTYAIIPLLYLASSLLHRAKIVQPSFCSSAKTWPVTFTAKTSRASVKSSGRSELQNDPSERAGNCEEADVCGTQIPKFCQLCCYPRTINTEAESVIDSR